MSPTPEQVGIFVLVGIALLPVVKEILLWGRKQKREVSFKSDFATAAELGHVKRELSDEIERVDQDVQALRESIVSNGEKRRIAIEGKVEDARREARVEATALHEKVNKVDRAVAGVQSSQEIHRQLLAQISEKLDRERERK